MNLRPDQVVLIDYEDCIGSYKMDDATKKKIEELSEELQRVAKESNCKVLLFDSEVLECKKKQWNEMERQRI